MSGTRSNDYRGCDMRHLIFARSAAGSSNNHGICDLSFWLMPHRSIKMIHQRHLRYHNRHTLHKLPSFGTCTDTKYLTLRLIWSHTCADATILSASWRRICAVANPEFTSLPLKPAIKWKSGLFTSFCVSKRDHLVVPSRGRH